MLSCCPSTCGFFEYYIFFLLHLASSLLTFCVSSDRICLCWCFPRSVARSLVCAATIPVVVSHPTLPTERYRFAQPDCWVRTLSVASSSVLIHYICQKETTSTDEYTFEPSVGHNGLTDTSIQDDRVQVWIDRTHQIFHFHIATVVPPITTLQPFAKAAVLLFIFGSHAHAASSDK